MFRFPFEKNWMKNVRELNENFFPQISAGPLSSFKDTGGGIPRENLIEEDRSLNTYENLFYANEIIKERDLQQPTLVTLDLYTRRAVGTARKMNWEDFFWLSVYSSGEPAHGYKWFQTHSRFTLYIYEPIAMIYSKWVGWV